ncbi:Aspartic proteinase nepenthesin-2 [Panicum miliaceum]|uniref:Aspartic proteinase nepenthesin-2 n=1 Tax=Panicum miliaceum TaxID=4540 RepID=A0A3L6TGD2_PANMI|nr:Aspartic proteinase nepenthesin-2 [Panicum miliaceum]
MAAVLGLGWRGAQSLGLQGFSYSVSSNGKISVSVGAGGDVPVARGGGTGTGTAALLSDPRYYPDLYYVNVTGIKVGEDLQQVPFPRPGALDLRQDGSGGGVFLSTTMPLTLLHGGVYNSLIRTLNAALPPASITRSKLSPMQLCYRRGTQTPTITLVLDDGGATMKLPAQNCWYKQPSDGSWCLAILPSPWPTGESLLGTMMQSGWRMTYDLNARTLTFQSSSSPVLPNSFCVLWALLLAAAAHVAFTFL